MPKKGAGQKPASSDTKDAKDQGSQSKSKKTADKDAINKILGESSAPAKPTNKQIVAGASWTGKLPVNLLSEHCQKQKWNKPDYDMRQFPEGYHSTVTLGVNLPKPRTVRFMLPKDHKALGYKPTAVEARNAAATYGLFRVCSHKNLHMMLPPDYRSFWKALEEIKKKDVKEGRAWQYDADPFKAAAEREVEVAEREKAFKKAAEQAKSEAGTPKMGKRWQDAPRLELGKNVRKVTEAIVRTKSAWNPNSVRMKPQEQTAVVNELVRLGFRKSHAVEAAESCKNREESLEFLLTYVPEDDLPSWCLPEGYTASISVGKMDLSKALAVERLAAAGYPQDLCEELLNKHDNEELAAEELQHRLLGTKLPDASTSTEAWDEELSTVEAIYGDKFERISPTIFSVLLDSNIKGLKMRIQRSRRYPETPPVISISSTQRLASYIRLELIRQLANEASASEEAAIFNMVNWIEMNLGTVLEKPGKLRTVLGALDFSEPINRTNSRRMVVRSARISKDDVTKRLQQRKAHPDYTKMQSQRQSLPAWKCREEVASIIVKNRVTIISGETGSGKSTQSVQFVLDDMIERNQGQTVNIVCTQPRRISAIGLAQRVSDERCSKLGQEAGYIIRGESKVSDTTQIRFMTTGVLLRQLQSGSGLSSISHFFIDEVHERSLDVDLLLVLLKELLRKGSHQKVVLMSATLDAAIFEGYFAAFGQVGRVHIEGRTFPVEDLYLDSVLTFAHFASEGEDLTGSLRALGKGINYDLIVATVQSIDEELGSEAGAILIFLPGTGEIKRAINALRDLPTIFALPLHASLLPQDQRKVFQPAPKGKRKVIAATNVAETSITLADVVAVIDTGRVKETSFDADKNMVRLLETWASKAACKQRRGRAGRVRAGKAYKLYTQSQESKMAERPDPEIKRVPLDQLCLSVKSTGVADVTAFLKEMISPPDTAAVATALKTLNAIGAMDVQELTALGKHLAMIPADMKCAKLLVYGAAFGCLEASLTVAAILTTKSPFLPTNREGGDDVTASRTGFFPRQSDILCDLKAYDAWKDTPDREKKGFCRDNHLSPQSLHDITTTRNQYLGILQENGFLPLNYNADSSPEFNGHSDSIAVIRSLIAASLTPHIARIQFPPTKFAASVSGAIAQDPEARAIKFFTPAEGRVFLHPSSTLFKTQTFGDAAHFISFFSKFETSKIFVSGVTSHSPIALALFGGRLEIDTAGKGLVIDGGLYIRCWARIAVLVTRLRALLDAVLERNIDHPGTGSNQEIMDVVRQVIEVGGLDA